jgi:hypothetical protein
MAAAAKAGGTWLDGDGRMVSPPANRAALPVAAPAMAAPWPEIADTANRHSLPSLSGVVIEYFRDGGLLYCGAEINVVDQFRQAENYVHPILRGEKPGDQPEQIPIRYELVINIKTAKAFGLSVPVPMLGLADEVIEQRIGSMSESAHFLGQTETIQRLHVEARAGVHIIQPATMALPELLAKYRGDLDKNRQSNPMQPILTIREIECLLRVYLCGQAVRKSRSAEGL